MIRLRWRGPFADPRFRRLLAGQSLSTFGDTALYLTLGIWAKALTGSNAAAGAVFLALGISALFAPAAGHLADRVRRRPLLLWTNALTAGLVLMLLAVRSPAQLWITAAWTMVVITPQTVSIATGAALISYVSYRVLLLAIIAVIGACAAYLLARPAPEPGQ